ncbi:MAG: class I SAM-dependent methyltransferase [Gemmatimonadota bacterium]
MFATDAELYDAIYFTFKDYAAEANDVAQRIRALHPAARSVLDVGCGTGEHARLLATTHGFSVDGIDINADFLRLAREKNPAGVFVTADMTAFDLGRRYDAVICMFSTIGYVQTLPRLDLALGCLARHVTDKGIVIVEPWFPPGVLEDGHHSTRSAEADGIRVTRDSSTLIDGRISRLRFDYTIDDGIQTRRVSEVHELGLFTPDETLRAFDAAGLDAQHEAPSERNRGLYIARRRA